MKLRALLAVGLMLVLSAAALAQNRPLVGPVITTAPTAAVVPLTSRGFTAQSADLIEATSLAGTVLFKVNSSGDTWVQSTLPQTRLTETDGAANAKQWIVGVADGGVLYLGTTRTDADGAGQTAHTVTRSGTTITDQAFGINNSAILKLGTSIPAEFTSSLQLTTAGTLLRFYGSTSALGALRGNTVGGLGVLDVRGADDAAYADLRVLDEVYGTGWNGNIAVPTKNAVYDKIETLVFGYSEQFGSASANPADAATYYVGSVFTDALSATAGNNKVYIPKTGTIKKVYIMYRNTTPGSNETSTVYVRLNNTTDTSVSAAVDNSNAVQTVSNTGLSIAVTAGDYVEIKWVAPTWATNPLGTVIAGVLFVE